MTPLPVCDCSCCESWENISGLCAKDKRQHPPDDACIEWERPLRRDMSGVPFKVQAINDPPDWNRIKESHN